MGAKRRVISGKQLPFAVSPLGVVWRFGVVYMMMDYYSAHPLIRGAVYLLFAFLLGVSWLMRRDEVHIDMSDTLKDLPEEK